jgi:hypothetical protein
MSKIQRSNTIDIQRTIQTFLAAAHKDGRILPLHISLFMAICWSGTPDKDTATLTIYRKDVMPLARIGSSATYHKFVKELVAYKYLEYQPSHDYYTGSKVSFRDI